MSAPPTILPPMLRSIRAIDLVRCPDLVVLAAALLLALGLGCSTASPGRAAAGRQTAAAPRPRGATPSTAPAPAASPAPGLGPSSVPAATPPPATASFLAVGDILLSRQVAARIAEHDDPLWPFRNMADVFGTVDFCFGNLESPFSGSDQFSRSSAQIFNSPRGHIVGLQRHGFRLVNLANNHALDQGIQGLRFTLEHLSAHGIAAVGAGPTEQQAWAPAVVEAQGIRIGFVGASYASVNDNGTLRSPYVARIDQEHRLKAALASLAGRADLRVVTMHAGAEYNPRIQPAQRRFAELAIDLGADIVFGAHPHVLQPIERYRSRFIFYSLGNFIFDHVRPGTRDGLAVRTHVELFRAAGASRRATIARLELVPVVIEDRSTPRPARGSEVEAILAQLAVSDTVLTP